MAKLQLFALFCVIVLASCAQVPKANPEVKNIVDDVLALLDQLKTVVEDAVDSALASVGQLLNSVLTAADSIVVALNNTLVDTVSTLVQQIDALEEEAAAAGVDATVCIGSSIPDLLALPAKFLENTTTCLDAKVQEAKVEINQTISDIQSVEEVLVKYAQEIVNCTTLSIVKEVICIAGVSLEITGSLASLPLQITSEVVSLTQYVASLVTSLASCEVGVVAGLTTAGGTIVANVTECVNDLLNH